MLHCAIIQKMAKTIAFTADQRQKALVAALAKRLGFRNHSDMLRTWLEDSVAKNIPPDEQAQIVALYAPRGAEEIREVKPKKASRGR